MPAPTLPTLTPSPVNPSPSDGFNFASRAYAFLAWIYNSLVPGINAFVTAFNSASATITTYSDTASAAATTATTKASEASTSAGTATTKAGEASASAGTAATAKTAAESARDAAAASAAIADGVPRTTGTTKGDMIAYSAAGVPARLGIGAQGQVPRVSSAAATGIAWGDAPNPTLVVDGNFDSWFEATSQTTSGYGSDTMWINTHIGTTKTHSRQSFALGDTDTFDAPAKYYSRTIVSSVAGAGNRCSKTQNIEDAEKIAGRTVTLSFRAKADAAKNIAIEFAQSFGTGGSPSPGVTGIGSQLIALTTAWKKYTVSVAIPSVSGKTIGTDGNSVTSMVFWFDAGSSYASRAASLVQQSGTFDIAQVKLEIGSVATPFVSPDPQQELARVRRYFWAVSPNRDTSGLAVSATIATFFLSHPTEMRVAPAVTFPASYVVAQPGYAGSTGTSVTSVATSTRTSAMNISGCTGLTMGVPVFWNGTGLILVDARL